MTNYLVERDTARLHGRYPTEAQVLAEAREHTIGAARDARRAFGLAEQ